MIHNIEQFEPAPVAHRRMSLTDGVDAIRPAHAYVPLSPVPSAGSRSGREVETAAACSAVRARRLSRVDFVCRLSVA
jgi:hypothetical protein